MNTFFTQGIKLHDRQKINSVIYRSERKTNFNSKLDTICSRFFKDKLTKYDCTSSFWNMDYTCIFPNKTVNDSVTINITISWNGERDTKNPLPIKLKKVDKYWYIVDAEIVIDYLLKKKM